jgi:hypothetical protein
MDTITINITETPNEVTVNVYDSTAALRGGTTGQVLTKASNADLDFTWGAGGGGGGGIASVVGTADRITVDNTDPDNPIVDIAAAYDSAITAEIAAAVAPLSPKGYTPVISGQYRGFPGITTTTVTNLASNLRFLPYPIGRPHSISAIQVPITTGIAATNIRLALYSSDGNRPDEPLEESGNISSASPGVLTFSFSSNVALTDELYWLCFQVGNNSVAARAWATGPLLMPGDLNTFGAGAPFASWIYPHVFGVFPTITPASLISAQFGAQPCMEALVA